MVLWSLPDGKVLRTFEGNPERPLVIVDGTSSREHDIERWKDEKASPIALADRGLLVLVDGAALPRDIQVLVARALTERRPPWERAMPIDVAIGVEAPMSCAAVPSDMGTAH